MVPCILTRNITIQYKTLWNILKQNLIYKNYVVMISLILAPTRIALIGVTHKALLVG